MGATIRDGNIIGQFVDNGKETSTGVSVDIVDNAITEYVNPEGVTKISAYKFANTKLSKLDLTGITEIEQNAFYNAQIGTPENPVDLTLTNTSFIINNDVQSNAQTTGDQFRYKDTNTPVGGINLTLNDVNIDGNAFSQNRSILSIKGTITSSSTNYVNFDATNLRQLDLTVHNCYLNLSSTPRTPLEYVVYRQVDNNTSPFGLLESTISGLIMIPRVAYINKLYTNVEDLVIYLGAATRLPTVNYPTFTGKIFVDYSVLTELKQGNSSITLLDKTYGYSQLDSLSEGENLPNEQNDYGLTWYSDENLTQKVTTKQSGIETYYCASTPNKIYVPITFTETNGTIKLVDDFGYEYHTGDKVLVGTKLTAMCTPTVTDYGSSEFTLNGQVIPNPYTFTVESGVSINLSCTYIVGQYEPNFADNTWAQISEAINQGIAVDLWGYDSYKTFTMYDLNGQEHTYSVNIADDQRDRYTLVGNETEYAHGVLEIKELIDPSGYGASDDTPRSVLTNGTGTLSAGYVNSFLATTLMDNIYNALPDDLKAIIKQVNVKANNGNRVIEDVPQYVFPAAQIEMCGVRGYARDGEGTQFTKYAQYGANLNAVAGRIKQLNEMDSQYYLRSAESNTFWVGIKNTGAGNWNPRTSDTSQIGGIAIFFAV